MWHWPSLGPAPSTENALEEHFDRDDFGFANTLVREAVQNSLDARFDTSAPVRIVFRQLRTPREADNTTDLSGLAEHRSKCRLATPKTAETSWLVIEDFNTTGLRGTLDDRSSDFWNYWLNFGRSNKGHGSRGRHGVGRITFLMASQLNAVIGVTRRRDDERVIAAGIAGLRSEQVGDSFNAPHAVFAESVRPPSLWKPFVEDTTSAALCEAFGLGRMRGHGDDAYGFALAIPEPYEDLTEAVLAGSIIEHFLPAILADQLVVSVNDIHITPATALEVGRRFDDQIHNEALRKGLGSYGSLISRTISGATEVEILKLEKPRRLKRGDVEEVRAEVLQERFRNGEDIVFQICFPLPMRDGSAPETEITVALSRSEPGEGVEGYYRQGMSMPDARMNKLRRQLNGLVLAEHEDIADYLNVCEGKAHLSWGRTDKIREKLRERYGTPEAAARDLCALVLQDLRDALELYDLGKDTKSLASLFPKPPAPGANIGDRPVPPTVPTPPTARPELGFRTRGSGFEITGAALTPGAHITVTLAYADGRANPQKRWRPSDFEAHELQIGTTGCETKEATGNRIELEVLESEIRALVIGFDRNREVDARIDVVTQAEEELL